MKVDPVRYNSEGKLRQIREDGNYNYLDIIELSDIKYGEKEYEKKVCCKVLHLLTSIRLTLSHLALFQFSERNLF